MSEGFATITGDEAERSLLGAILTSYVALVEAIGLVNAGDFRAGEFSANALIFTAAVNLHGDGKPVDIVTVANALEVAGKLTDIGGVEYLSNLADAAPSTSHYRGYSDIITEKAAKRALERFGHETAIRAKIPGEPVTEAFADVERKFLELLERCTKSETKHVSETVKETWDAIDARRARGERLRGLSSGYANLDAITAGFKPGELIIVAARPSVGKTAIAVNIARHIAVGEKASVLFVSLEQSRVELTERLLCCEGMIDSHRINIGRLRSDEVDRVFSAGETLTRSRLYIDDTSGQTQMQIAANVRRMKRRAGIGLVIVDYLQLIERTGLLL